jgi:hypothetical protein
MGIPVRFVSCLARFGAALIVTTLVALGSAVYAQELEPRAYTNTPVGLNFLIAAYAYSSGGVATDSTPAPVSPPVRGAILIQSGSPGNTAGAGGFK